MSDSFYRKPMPRGVLLSLAGIVIGVVAGLWCLFYVLQDQLIFFPRPLTEERRSLIRKAHPTAFEIELKASDGNRLHGWFVPSSGKRPAPLVIYFGGNAEEVSWLMAEGDKFAGWSLLLMNYRGYGLSTGKPSERAFFEDALTVYDHAATRPEVNRTRIIAMGRSLGSGVAVYLAAMRPLSAAILVTPLDSVPSVAREHYPFLPVSWFIRHRFDSLSRAPHIVVPATFIAAENDQIVPPAHARALFDAWGGPKEWHLIAKTDHNDIMNSEGCWGAIEEFLRELSHGVPISR